MTVLVFLIILWAAEEQILVVFSGGISPPGPCYAHQMAMRLSMFILAFEAEQLSNLVQPPLLIFTNELVKPDAAFISILIKDILLKTRVVVVVLGIDTTFSNFEENTAIVVILSWL